MKLCHMSVRVRVPPLGTQVRSRTLVQSQQQWPSAWQAEEIVQGKRSLVSTVRNIARNMTAKLNTLEVANFEHRCTRFSGCPL